MKSAKSKFSSILKWLFIAVLALVGLKIFAVVFSTLSVGIALASLAMWAVGLLVMGGGLIFVVSKILKSKKK